MPQSWDIGHIILFLISSFRRVQNVVCFLLGDSPASDLSDAGENKQHIILLPLRRKAYWRFSGRPKNTTALAGFEPANSGSSGQYANH